MELISSQDTVVHLFFCSGPSRARATRAEKGEQGPPPPRALCPLQASEVEDSVRRLTSMLEK